MGFSSSVLALILLGGLLTGSCAQPVLTQPAIMQVSPGQTVHLSCRMEIGYHIAEHHVSWYQQRPGSAPRYLLTYYSDSGQYHGSGVPSRFSASKDLSSNTCILTIAKVQAEDAADYYCAVAYTIYYL
ncbi:pre-B lymphocyte protein 3 [Rhinatrema bivittatum]|uniref:pre-B lymphocyte protein 3 n=1 Tax=Rhinatrema bivittatum TaxID=194408 RepID=UPI001128A951|nr:pre-B lymphocyte protein 3 [Rhinatrema bivittatum]